MLESEKFFVVFRMHLYAKCIMCSCFFHVTGTRPSIVLKLCELVLELRPNS